MSLAIAHSYLASVGVMEWKLLLNATVDRRGDRRVLSKEEALDLAPVTIYMNDRVL